jgi:hypothetical protein
MGWPIAAPVRAWLASWATRARCKPSRGARPRTRRSMPRRWRCGGAVAGSPRPRYTPPRCGPPGLCSDGACHACASGRPS